MVERVAVLPRGFQAREVFLVIIGQVEQQRGEHGNV